MNFEYLKLLNKYNALRGKFPHKPLGISHPTNLSCLLRKTYNEFRRKQSNLGRFRGNISSKIILDNAPIASER
jgi:hypothetical protein